MARVTMEDMASIISGEVEAVEALTDRVEQLVDAAVDTAWSNHIGDEVDGLATTHGFDVVANLLRPLDTRGLDYRLVDAENKLSTLEDLLEQALSMEDRVAGHKETRGLWNWLCNYLYGKVEETRATVLDSEPNVSVEEEHVGKEPSRWERGKLMMEFIQEHFRQWDLGSLIKFNRLVNKKNKLEDSDKLSFPHWVACKLMLEYAISHRAKGKLAARANKSYKAFLEMYYKYNLEERLSEDKFISFNEEYDPEARFYSNIGLQAHQMAHMVDVISDARVIASKRGIAVEEALEALTADM
ncbi:MAG: hypothetical protein ACXADY_26310 [Candidatus Hodarchaeales archaeon]|jgi:hypothetical protein